MATGPVKGELSLIVVDEEDIEVISDELSDEDLEMVRGGMSEDVFNIWKLEIINEDW